MKKIKALVSITLFLFFANHSAIAEDGKGWTASSEPTKAFIENKGQYRMESESSIHTSAARFVFDGGSTKVYFTSTGVSYSFLQKWSKKKEKDPKEIVKELKREQRELQEGKSHAEIEAEEHHLKSSGDYVTMIWEGADPNVQIVSEQPTLDYYCYTVQGKNGQAESISNVMSFKKITYKNLYPNIDIEFVFHPQDGLKYNIILHPGSDPSLVKMKYSRAVGLENGDIHIKTKFGDIVDHAPESFYSNNVSESIGSKFIKNGKVVSFQLENYDASRLVVIDPWTQTPALSNSNGVWECEKDAAGNVYIIGGDAPLKLRKYNSLGVLQWTYNTPFDTTNDGDWLGTMATDLAGNSYVTNGSSARLLKVNTAGVMVYLVNGGSLDEYWNIAFNCDQTKLIVGGTRLGFGIPAPGTTYIPGSNGMIFDINTANGAVLATKKVGWNRTTTVFGFAVTDVNEVRSITASRNSRYYFLTLDSIGCIDQNFSSCPSSTPNIFSINSSYNFSYKCENFRPDNGNSGICAVRANGNFLYSQNGSTLHKRSLVTGAILQTVAITGGISSSVTSTPTTYQAGNSGIDIDSCGNVYVGSGNGVIKYDANLNVLSTVATSFKVFDVAVSSAGNVIVCGATLTGSSTGRVGYVQQINMSSCNPMTLICCNSNFCTAGLFCATASPVTLTPDQVGGTWSGPGVNASTGVFSPSVAGPGTHTITYTLACGSSSIVIVVNPCTAPTLNACQTSTGNITVSNGSGTYTWYNSTTTTPCVPGLGNCSGFGTVPGTPVTTWSSFATGPTVTPGSNYPIWVVDSNSDSLQITSLASLPMCTSCPPLTVTPASQLNVNCFGQSTGSFSASTSGGASPYDYTLMNGAATIVTFANVAGSQNFTNLPAGTYTLNVLDNSGCPGTATITITQPASTTSVSITSSTGASCGSTNGSATATAAGGTSPYDYVWTGTSGTLQTTNNITGSNTLSGLAAGTYTVTITDGNNCTTSTTATITSTGGATVSITSQTNVLCFGGTTGNATATAAAGTSPYDYVWTGSAGTLQTINNIAGPNTLSGLAAGTYTVTITDNAGCTNTSTATIAEPASAASVTITGTTSPPCGSSTGTATAQASGGSSPYDYVWTGSSGTLQTTNNITTSNTLSGLAAGTYTVTITDNNGCATSTTATVTSSGGATISITSQTNVLCFGNSTGDATATATGGTSPYDYVWTNTGGTIQTANNIAGANTVDSLVAGTYTVTITDNSGCVSSTSVTLTQPATAATVTITGSTNAACGSANGSATAQASGGTGPYDYVWTGSAGTLQTNNNVSGSDLLNNIAAGTYTVTITDNSGCVSSTTAIVSNSGAAVTSVSSSTNVLCFGGNNGNATANTTGGSSPYDYVWTGSSGTLQTTNNITVANTLGGLTAGTYTVTVTDNAGCVGNATVIITQPASALSLTTVSVNPTTCGLNNGSASVSATGGTIGYSYSWATGGGTGASASGLASGTYTITVTDANSCTSTATAVIGTSIGITATTSPDVTIISGESTTLIASGGTSYIWSPSSGLSCTNCASPVASPSSTTIYCVTATNGNGCSDSSCVVVAVDIKCGELFVPTAFSPNNDGENDVLFVKGNCITSLSFSVFDRWGEKVFETSDPAKGWDGTINGKTLDTNVFVFYLTAKVNGVDVKKHGNITLVK